MATKSWRANNPGYQQRYMKAYREKNPDICLKHNLKKYGLSIEDFKLLRSVQNNRCLICSEQFTKAPSVDHDHKTGRVRGLLCSSCNHMIGFGKDNVKILQNGINYLMRNI